MCPDTRVERYAHTAQKYPRNLCASSVIPPWTSQLLLIGDKARRFVMEGMLGLVDQRARQAGRKGHVYPEAVAAYMLYVKQLYPPIHAREIVRIVARKFGYKTNKRFFERHTLPV